MVLLDPYHIQAKRKRKANALEDFLEDAGIRMPPLPAPSVSGTSK